MELGEDRVAWKYSSDGAFSLKSAYTTLVDNGEMGRREVWKRIWKWEGPQRVRSFLWLLAKGRLLTNLSMWKRGMADNSNCPRCDCSIESCLHMVRDCGVARKIWDRLVKPQEWVNFYSMDLVDWIYYGLSRNIGNRDWGDWKTVFGIACWLLWANKNDKVFNARKQNVESLLLCIIRWSREVVGTRDSLRKVGLGKDSRQMRWVGWEFPCFDWVKWNTDGSYKQNCSKVACGGVLRDSTGTWRGDLCRIFGVEEFWKLSCGV